MKSLREMSTDELLDIKRWCNVCTGRSPIWDGHNTNPPCEGAAKEEILRRSYEFDRLTSS